MESHDAEISRLLSAWSDGDLGARDRLVPLVFDELRTIARRQLRQERVGHTLQPTAIVNELYLRLVSQKQVQWRHRSEFYGVASTLIRRILVDHARKRQAARRGGQAVPMVSFEEALGVPLPEDSSILAVDEALEALSRADPRGAKVVELHAFGGLSFEEIAEVLKISRATALRDWNHAKLWLRRYLTRS